ncbi:MAG: PilZ domain-containing protein [Hyphomicrobiales bacterium]|nr:MAG: PilZ domain-containing protein [Hyphomicrobiales bacterium]
MQKSASIRARSGERRRHKRAHVLFNGRLISGDCSAQGVLPDVSAGGARMRLAEPFEAGSAITLRLARNLDFHVEVAWNRGQFFGLRFREAPARIAATLSGLLPQDCLAA